ncbi:MAG: hypothetical protein HY334_04700 [Armatimonadetes bacterium]|nr:hypothetical protein [Armatimonadota bacterium]
MIARTLAGDPIPVGDREIVPIVRVTGIGRMQPGRGDGMGGGLLRAVPIAAIERRGDLERRIVIRDATGEALRGIVAAGIGIWVMLWIVRRRWSHGR